MEEKTKTSRILRTDSRYYVKALHYWHPKVTYTQILLFKLSLDIIIYAQRKAKIKKNADILIENKADKDQENFKSKLSSTSKRKRFMLVINSRNLFILL